MKLIQTDYHGPNIEPGYGGSDDWRPDGNRPRTAFKVPDRQEEGPIRIQLQAMLHARIGAELERAGKSASLLTCSCGYAPDARLLRRCGSCTGVDISQIGSQPARKWFEKPDGPPDFESADACDLPFADGRFDVVYCPHMVQAIPKQTAQALAIHEMLRVTRPGGTVVLTATNPRPKLSPFRQNGSTARTLDNPQSIGWMRKTLSGRAGVEVITAGIASTKFNRMVSEFRYPGKALWRAICHMEKNWPHVAAHLGSNVAYICRKPTTA